MGIQNEEELEKLEKDYEDRISRLQERWRWLKLDGKYYKYRVSNHGSIKNLDGHIMYITNKKGYGYVNLLYDAGVRKNFQIHRLVALTFLPIPQKYIDQGYTAETLQINHIDGCPMHNDLWNLEWCTAKENTHHAHRTGLAWSRYGQYNNMAVLDNETVKYICELFESGCSIHDIQKEFPDIKRETIMAIQHRENWKEVSKSYNVDNFPTFNMPGETFRKKVFHELNIGATFEDIGKKYNLKPSHIRYIEFCYTHDYITNPFNFMDKYVNLISSINDLTDDQTREICYYLSESKSNCYIRSRIPVTNNVIQMLHTGQYKQEIVSQYNIVSRRKELPLDTIHSICKDIVYGGLTIYQVAAKWGISSDYAYALTRNEHHPEITTQYPLADHVRSRLTDDMVRAIWRDIASRKMTISNIAKKHGMSDAYVKKLKSGKLRPDIRREFID